MTAKIISLVNMKGGVGKTTFTANFGYTLSYYKNKKVLLVDLDPQFNLTQYFIPVNEYAERFKNGGMFLKHIFNNSGDFFSLIEGKIEDEEVKFSDLRINLRNFKDGGILDLLPSDLDLANIPENGEYKLLNFLKKINDQYDYILIDCPPTISKFTKLAFIASDYYIVPAKKEYFGIIGLDLLTRRIKDFESLYSEKIKYLGLAFVSVNARKWQKNNEIDNKLIENNEIIFSYNLSEHNDYLNACELNLSILEHTNNDKLKNELYNLTDEILLKLEK